VYSISVPTNQRVTATLTPTFNATLNAVVGGAANCGTLGTDGGTQGVTCISGSDNFGATAAETVTYANTTTGAQNVLILVDSTTSTVGSFDLTTALSSFPVGDVCTDTLTAITASVSRMETLTGHGNDFNGFLSGCALAGGEDRAHRITIPAGFRLTATTSSTADHGLSLVGGPAANCAPVTACLARADVTFGGTMPVLEVLTFDNASATARDVFLLVDRFGTSGSPDYQLSVDLIAIPAPAYTKTTTPQACSTLASPTTLITTIGDDSTSATTALPIPFSFFGTAMTHFGVSTNGKVQFFTASSATVSNEWGNVSIPTAATPNGIAAAFWDDLHVPLAGGAPAIRFETTGAAPNRVVTIEWFDISLATGAGSPTFPGVGTRSELMNFQVKLFETTNVVEFHYCSLNPGTGLATAVSGSGATIGLENTAGTEGVQHSFNTANSVNTTDALRFTP
jgi:hypothetical protein